MERNQEPLNQAEAPSCLTVKTRAGVHKHKTNSEKDAILWLVYGAQLKLLQIWFIWQR